ncbi:MAG TPA: hypothetical protein VFH43_11685, partial [Candidatus Kapabacteria bacterium]|nr:hypothetical protein [Candidatus Kapabacteria bacterium]
MLRVLLFVLIVMSRDSLAQTALPEFDKLWNYSKPAETEKIFRELVPQADSSADLNYALELQTQIARTQALQTKFDDAHKTLDAVRSALDQRRGSEKMRASLRYELERGRVYNSSNQKEKAIEHFNRALELGIALKEDNLAVDAAHMLGIATTGEASLMWNERAMQMAEASEDKRAKGWLGALYNNIGWTYHGMGKNDVALSYFEKDLLWYEERKLENQSRI